MKQTTQFFLENESQILISVSYLSQCPNLAVIVIAERML